MQIPVCIQNQEVELPLSIAAKKKKKDCTVLHPLGRKQNIPSVDFQELKKDDKKFTNKLLNTVICDLEQVFVVFPSHLGLHNRIYFKATIHM